MSNNDPKLDDALDRDALREWVRDNDRGFDDMEMQSFIARYCDELRKIHEIKRVFSKDSSCATLLAPDNDDELER